MLTFNAAALFANQPILIPRGVFLELQGELRLMIDRDNHVYIQKGAEKLVHRFQLDVVAWTRNEYWCETRSYSSKNMQGDIHAIFSKLKPDSLYTTAIDVTGYKIENKPGKRKNKNNSASGKATMVLGNVEAIAERPMRLPLAAFRQQTHFILTWHGQNLELVVFDGKSEGQLIILKRVY